MTAAPMVCRDLPEHDLFAIHEAGHAVAAELRGATEVKSWLHADGSGGLTEFNQVWPSDIAFIAYAGPWAQARALWPGATLDGEDDEGCIFGDYIVGALMGQESDVALLVDWLGNPINAATEHVWGMELEREWPAIQERATTIPVKPDDADDLP